MEWAFFEDSAPLAWVKLKPNNVHISALRAILLVCF
jgi:hypothetical protein